MVISENTSPVTRPRPSQRYDWASPTGRHLLFECATKNLEKKDKNQECATKITGAYQSTAPLLVIYKARNILLLILCRS